jgi:phosphoglycolate phosphatase-like HAD superfamily hydrolase
MRPRLVLWDIDRTLIFAGGVDKGIWIEVCSELVGRPVTELAGTSGRTDPQILLDALLRAGVGEAEAGRLLPKALHMEVGRLAAKRDELRARGRMLPGADAALAALASTPGVVQSVLTGNVKPNAILKLATFGLDRYIDFEVGAYGSDDGNRPVLVRLDLDESSTVIVGDSLRDVEAGRVGGARVVAVATGRTDADALREAGAETVLADLADTEAVLRAVLAEHPTRA